MSRGMTSSEAAEEIIKRDRRRFLANCGVYFVLLSALAAVVAAGRIAASGARSAPADAAEPPRSGADRFLEFEGVCDIMHVFSTRGTSSEDGWGGRGGCAPKRCEGDGDGDPDAPERPAKRGQSSSTVACLCLLVVLLVFSIFASIADVLGEKEEEEGEESAGRRCSLATFASVRLKIRRESAAPRRPPLSRFESVGTAFGRLRREALAAVPPDALSAPSAPDTPPPSARASPRLLGARPPLLRRSSFPAASLLDGSDLSRRSSVDSEDDASADIYHRRVRFIRRH